ncbi:DUF4097 domain-containing protein [Bacillaceae bacterium CLA-AA-H227]|uniref:DUF4097 domain-containing protein n=1 Tax=Robertmurraya yapensis (ex Hitch et al 2024) TaxID=3133160 RepID=A0ACC6SG51_9BACI
MEQERKRILTMVKEGRLTVNEALELLDALGESEKGSVVGELSTNVKFEESKKDDPFANQKFHAAKDRIFEFVDTAIQKIKDIDLDFNFGQSTEISHNFQESDVYLKEIDVDIANGSVKIVPWEKQDVSVECVAKVYRVDSQEEARDTFLKDVTFAIDGGKLRFNTQQKWMKVHTTLYIPQSEYEHVKIRMFNGSVDSENLHVEKYHVKTANGKINLYSLTSKYVDAETANGQIEVRDANIDDLEMETLNGAIKIDGNFRKLDVQSFNGGIDCSVNNTNCEIIEVKTAAGGIKLYIPEAAVISGELKSNLGNFNDIDRSDIQVLEEKSEVMQKLLRFLPVTHAEQITRIEADAKTGSISLKRVKSF